ncbi:hypothetical protein LJC34_05485 [Oscillospiraceae bacterium OttesenSCG-928-G22]|nr:hypothetical protein [Oscillospiraceae bacterium OttesenSCG-928-G22]
MAFTSRFFNSTRPPEEDAGYAASDFAEYFAHMVRSGVFVTADANALLVGRVSNTMKATVADGMMFINGHAFLVSGGAELTLDNGGSTARVDRIVARLDFTTDATGNERVGSIYPAVLTGTPAAVPLTRNNEIYEMCLAEIAVPANALSLNSATITDRRGDNNLCGYASFMGQPAYQPPGDIPAIVWQYTIFPDTLTAQQKQDVENTPAWKSLWDGSRVSDIITNLVPQYAPGSYFLNPYKNRVEIKTTQTWRAPAGVTVVDALLVGGGGGSGAPGGGGGRFLFKKRIAVTPNQSYTITIGSGGAGGTGTATSGGTTSAFGYSAAGGSPSSGDDGGDGGNGGGSYGTTNYAKAPNGGSYGSSGDSGGSGAGGRGLDALTVDPYTGIPYCGGGAGNAYGYGGAGGGGGRGSSAGTPNTGGGGSNRAAGGSGIVVIYY